MIDYVKWLLLAFENLSGLKVSFAKSEIYPLNITYEESIVFANVFGCKITILPLTYLGVPIHLQNLTVDDWHI